MTALEKAARAVQTHLVEKHSADGYLGWEYDGEEEFPPLTKTYVDADLDLVGIARAVLMAVREPGGVWFQNQEDKGLSGEDAVCVRYFIDAILNEEPK